MTGGQLGCKSFPHILVDRRPRTALKVLHMQEEECKQQAKHRPHFFRAGCCSSREFKGQTEMIGIVGSRSDLLIIARHYRASNQTIQQNLCLFMCDPS